MSIYKFRGHVISGLQAWRLLQALKIVMEEIPNPTEQDMEELAAISTDFERKFTESLQEASKDPSYIQSTKEWLEDE